jgi:hypothetical protein
MPIQTKHVIIISVICVAVVLILLITGLVYYSVVYKPQQLIAKTLNAPGLADACPIGTKKTNTGCASICNESAGMVYDDVYNVCKSACDINQEWNPRAGGGSGACVVKCNPLIGQKISADFSACENICLAGTKWDMPNQKCVNVCTMPEMWLDNKCQDPCAGKPNSTWDANVKKCVCNADFIEGSDGVCVKPIPNPRDLFGF